jgi:hypothetical protein
MPAGCTRPSSSGNTPRLAERGYLPRAVEGLELAAIHRMLLVLQKDNFIVAHDVARPLARRLGDLTVNVVNLKDLVSRVTAL